MGNPTVNSKFILTFTSATSEFAGLTLAVKYWSQSDWPGTATGTIADGALTSKNDTTVVVTIAKNLLTEAGIWRFQLFDATNLVAFQPVYKLTVALEGE